MGTGADGYLTIRSFCASNDGVLYNARLLSYPNGSIQLRLYSVPVLLGGSQQRIDTAPAEHVREPFTGHLVRVVEDFDLELSDLQRQTENRRSSLSRAKRCISEYARAAKWSWFCTFTFAPEKAADRSDYAKCCKQMRIWLKNARDRKAPDLQYLAVPELHRDGRNWHFHVLLARTGTIEFEDSRHRKAGHRIYNVPGWRMGFSTATEILDTFRISKYIVKYLSKECHLLAKGDHRYFVSQNLPKPSSRFFLVEPGQEDAWVRSLAESLKMQVTWENTVCGNYMDIRYIELG